MDEEIAVEWLSDLRSGNYPQGFTYLNRQGRFCCLGVLCEQAKRAGIVQSRTSSDGTVDYYDPLDEDDHSEYRLPQVVKKWAGMGTALGEFYQDEKNVFRLLSEVNDKDRENFPTIADLIEQSIANL